MQLKHIFMNHHISSYSNFTHLLTSCKHVICGRRQTRLLFLAHWHTGVREDCYTTGVLPHRYVMLGQGNVIVRTNTV